MPRLYLEIVQKPSQLVSFNTYRKYVSCHAASKRHNSEPRRHGLLPFAILACLDAGSGDVHVERLGGGGGRLGVVHVLRLARATTTPQDDEDDEGDGEEEEAGSEADNDGLEGGVFEALSGFQYHVGVVFWARRGGS